MTYYVLDVASYQGALLTSDVARAGFDGVNLKTSHGRTQKSVHPDVAGWASRARQLNLAVTTFHWLTADTPGADQAAYALSRLRDLGLVSAGHIVDVEEPALTWTTISTYVQAMKAALGRTIFIYSADWRWESAWSGSALSPYLWAAPNAGYLPAYPGDASSHWAAGYGGWPALSLMQYAVAPLTFPDGSTGSIKVSKTAVRDPMVWRVLTGGDMTTEPASCLAVREEFQSRTGLSNNALGIVGDDNHVASGSSYHLGKSALRPDSYTIIESPRDRAGLSEAASANDIGQFSIVVGGKTHGLRSFSRWLVAECEAGAPDTLDIREVIYSPDGVVVKRWDRLRMRTGGPLSHLTHTHISWFRDSEGHDRAAVIRRYFAEIGGNVSKQDVLDGLTEFFAVTKQADGTSTSRIGRDALSQGVPDFSLGGKRAEAYTVLRHTGEAVARVEAGVKALTGMVQALAGRDGADEQAIVAGVLAGLNLNKQEVADGVAEAVVAALPEGAAQRLIEALIAQIRRGTGSVGT